MVVFCPLCVGVFYFSLVVLVVLCRLSHFRVSFVDGIVRGHLRHSGNCSPENGLASGVSSSLLIADNVAVSLYLALNQSMLHVSCLV